MEHYFIRTSISIRYSLVTFFLLAFSSPGLAQQDQWQGIEKIVAVGDIHGDYEQYIAVLRDAGLINRRGNWIAEQTHFVQLGDIPDRGPGTDRIIRHLQKLEGQAERDGGKVHALIGNHEAMNIGGDLRYVHPGEYEALTSRRSRQLQDAYYERVVEYMRAQDPELILPPDHREQWNQQFPRGYVEHRTIWGPEGEFGRWVNQHNAVIKINNLLFIHGGISPQILGMGVTAMNDQIRAELANQSITLENRISESDDGPLWYRGLATNDEEAEAAHVQQVLDFYDVDHVVVAHTPELGTVMPRFGGKVIVVDVGISNYYGNHNASLLIEGDQLFNVHRGESIPVPTGTMSLLTYYQRIAELEPDLDRLGDLIKDLEARSAISTQ